MKIFRTLFSLCVVFLMTSTAYAAMQGNWLVGVSGDYATRKGNINIAMAYTAIPAFPLTEIIVEHTDKGIYWGVLAGYQLKCRGWTWGAEVNLDWPDIGDTFQ